MQVTHLVFLFTIKKKLKSLIMLLRQHTANISMMLATSPTKWIKNDYHPPTINKSMDESIINCNNLIAVLQQLD